MVGYGTPWSGMAPCGRVRISPCREGQGDTEHTQAKNWLSRDSTSVLPSPFSAEKGTSGVSGVSSSVWRMTSRFGSTYRFFSLSTLLATTSIGQPASLNQLHMVTSSAEGLCRASTMSTPSEISPGS